MLEFLSLREVDQLISFGYFYGPRWREESGASLSLLKKWSIDVDMKIYYCGGSLYFENEEDLINFQLRWC